MSGILDILAKLTDGQILRRVGKNLVGVDVSALNPAGNWVPDGNNTRDLGATGTRWRTGYFGTLVDTPRINMAPAAATSGVRTAFALTGAADTGLTAATEQTDVDLHLGRTVTWAAGAGPLAAQRAIRVRAPTYAGNAGTPLTITHASTLEIDTAPQAGSNVTLTNAWAMRVVAGAVYFGGTVVLNVAPRVAGLNDSAGNTALEVAATASAVNGLRLTNSATGQPVEVYPQGVDANCALAVSGKGTGAYIIRAGNGAARFTANNTGVAFFSATPQAQGAHIPNATDGTDVITRLNELLAYLRLRGDIASS